jgi:hypothetical protein
MQVSGQILACFLLVKSPTKGLTVLYFPFREVIPFRRKFCAIDLNGACSQRLPSHNTTKADDIVANTGRAEAAKRCEQKVGVAMAPRRTAQHTVFILRIVPILAPVPHPAPISYNPFLFAPKLPTGLVRGYPSL